MARGRGLGWLIDEGHDASAWRGDVATITIVGDGVRVVVGARGGVWKPNAHWHVVLPGARKRHRASADAAIDSVTLGFKGPGAPRYWKCSVESGSKRGT
jgi:hypothetical protein